MALDETYPNEPTQRARDIQAYHLRRQREDKRRQFGPLSYDSLRWIDASIEKAISWCNDGREAEALLAHLTNAKNELEKIRKNRSV